MYKEILIATDGSELANRALAHGLKLANEVKARVTIVTVTAPWSALDLAHEAACASRILFISTRKWQRHQPR